MQSCLGTVSCSDRWTLSIWRPLNRLHVGQFSSHAARQASRQKRVLKLLNRGQAAQNGFANPCARRQVPEATSLAQSRNPSQWFCGEPRTNHAVNSTRKSRQLNGQDLNLHANHERVPASSIGIDRPSRDGLHSRLYQLFCPLAQKRWPHEPR